MKTKEVYVVDEKLCEALTHFGFCKNDAKILLFLLKEKKAITIDVERAVFLRQPEVSVGLKNLRKLGLVKKQDIPRESKGRPIHEYSLNQSKQMFLKKHIEKEVDTQKKFIEQNFELIRNALTEGD